MRLLGGVSLTNARRENTNSGANDGSHPIGVPDWTANANIEYDVPRVPGFTLMARAIYTGQQYLDEANALRHPSWTRFDLEARYKMQASKHDAVLRLMLTNVANCAYWSSALGGYLLQGAPRTAWLSVSTDF